MEYNDEYMNAGYGAFSFEEDPLSEDENEDIHHAVEHFIFESNSSELSFEESSYTEEDEQLTAPTQGSMEHSDESTRQRRKGTLTKRRSWWRKLFSSLNIFKKSKQYDEASWDSSSSESDSNSHVDQVCDLCDEAMPSNRLLPSYWGQKICNKHVSDGTPMCLSCLRFKIGNMRYVNLSDGRKLCSDCHCTAVMDPKTFIPLLREVYRFYKGFNMQVIEDIPIFLVDNEEMKRIAHEIGGKDQPGYPVGVTTYASGFVVRSVARSYQKGENIHVVKEVQYIERIYEVTSMLIVYGFPRLALGATMAHEMMHAWMRIEGYKAGLRKEVNEGLCQVMAHKWIDYYAFVGDDFLHTTPDQAEFLRNLKEVLKNEIEIRMDKIYGGGFRDAKWAIERYGLKYTMSHVAHTGNFPR
ncbi:protein DA1 [Daucus carota subsp. sativus]|uniref:protein DA1 n=1 Tax=Daucus carota subsp. sativus TaxID=79200 RepID=UPI0007EFB49F|nr:PREDICTED: protein DA1-like isoform X1 [Daucus carota subsp. sativus]